jgi:hypothetical protein
VASRITMTTATVENTKSVIRIVLSNPRLQGGGILSRHKDTNAAC